MNIGSSLSSFITNRNTRSFAANTVKQQVNDKPKNFNAGDTEKLSNEPDIDRLPYDIDIDHMPEIDLNA